MNAKEALILTESVIPLKDEKEYIYITERIKVAANNGEKKLRLSNIPSKSVLDTLKTDGYNFYIYSLYSFPDMYVISWEKEKWEKLNFFQKLFK